MGNHVDCLYICVLVVFLSCMPVSGSGYVQIKLEAYWSRENKDMNGHCCQQPSTTVRPCNPCDPYFKIYLGRLNDTSVNVSQIMTTPTYMTSSNVTFNNNFGSFHNPLKLYFQRFSTSFYLFIQVMQNGDVTTTAVRPLELLQYHVGQGEPGKYYSLPPYIKKDINGTTAALDFNYRIKCDQFYYGNCNVFCQPCPGQYNCSNHGNKLYESGMTGLQCNSTASTSGRPATTFHSLTSGATPYTRPMFSTIPNTNSSAITSIARVSSTAANPVSTVSVHQSSVGVTNTGLIAGAAVGAALLLAGLVVIGVWLKKRSKRTVTDEPTSNDYASERTG